MNSIQRMATQLFRHNSITSKTISVITLVTGSEERVGGDGGCAGGGLEGGGGLVEGVGGLVEGWWRVMEAWWRVVEGWCRVDQLRWRVGEQGGGKGR